MHRVRWGALVALLLLILASGPPTQATNAPFQPWLPLAQHEAWITGPLGGTIVWTPVVTHWIEPGESKYQIRYTGNGWVGQIWWDDGFGAQSRPICTACPDVWYVGVRTSPGAVNHLRVGVQTLDPYVESSIWDIEVKVGP